VKKMAKKETKKASSAVAKLVDEIGKLSVLELSELVNELQEKLGVSAMPVAATPQAGQVGGQAAEASEGEAAAGAKQTVILAETGGNKIAVIKAIREINQNLGLKEAKDMTENTPAEILKEVKAEEAKEAAEKLKTAGAKVELK
jgi:large subunit ribosomal protein L7/L12